MQNGNNSSFSSDLHSCRDGTGDVIAKSVLIRVMLFLIIVALISSYTIVVLVSTSINFSAQTFVQLCFFFRSIQSLSSWIYP